MKHTFVILAAALAGAAHAAPISMLNPVPYADSAIVAGKIKRECTIDAQLADAIKRSAATAGKEVNFVPAPLADAKGEVLKLEISDAVSEGNAWMGHHKSVTVRGALLRDGTQVASFVGRRDLAWRRHGRLQGLVLGARAHRRQDRRRRGRLAGRTAGRRHARRPGVSGIGAAGVAAPSR